MAKRRAKSKIDVSENLEMKNVDTFRPRPVSVVTDSPKSIAQELEEGSGRHENIRHVSAKSSQRRLSSFTTGSQRNSINAFEEKFVNNLQSESAADGGWTSLEARFKSYDEQMVNNWNEEIDTLLVFAGLFSATLTAFNIEIYKRLQPDSGDLSNHLLQQISLQLASLTLNSGFINSTYSPAFQPPFQPPAFAVRLNILWFSSLVCSLISASLGMLVKQWLREYLACDYSSPRERIRIREFRHGGLQRWRVLQIMAFLPTLLQISLILFFIGLIDFLRTLDPAVATVITVFICSWIIIHGATTCLPTAYPACPYKSPQARAFHILTRPLREGVWNLNTFLFEFMAALTGAITRRYGDILGNVNPRIPPPIFQSLWSDRERNVRRDASQDVGALITADQTFADDDYLDSTVRQCLQDMEGVFAVRCIAQILDHRVSERRTGKFTDPSGDLYRVTGKGRITAVHIILDAFERKMSDPLKLGEGPNMPPWVRDGFDCVKVIIENGWPSEVDTVDLQLSVLEERLTHVLCNLLNHESFPVVKKVLTTLSIRPTICARVFTMEPTAFVNTVDAAIALFTSNYPDVDPLPLCTVILILACRVPPDGIPRSSFANLLIEIKKVLVRTRVKWTYPPEEVEECIMHAIDLHNRAPQSGVITILPALGFDISKLPPDVSGSESTTS